MYFWRRKSVKIRDNAIRVKQFSLRCYKTLYSLLYFDGPGFMHMLLTRKCFSSFFSEKSLSFRFIWNIYLVNERYRRLSILHELLLVSPYVLPKFLYRKIEFQFSNIQKVSYKCNERHRTCS